MNEGEQFAARWADAWNGGELERALALWTDDLQFESPLAAEITGSPVVEGKHAAAAYWGKALGQAQRLQFDLIDVFWDPEKRAVTIIYRRERAGDVRVAAEIARLDKSGRAYHGRALHGAPAV